jgi:hypothetical protein
VSAVSDIGLGRLTAGPEEIASRRAARRTRSLAILSLLLLGWAAWDLWRISDGTGTIAGRFSPRWALYLSGYVLIALAAGGAALAAAVRPHRFLRAASPLEAAAQGLPGALGWVLGIASLGAAVALLLAHDVDTLQIFSLRLLLMLGAGLAAALFTPSSGWGYAPRLGLAVMTLASGYVIATRLALVTDYPFSLSWSEGNRLWDYSLLFGRAAYQVAGEFSFPSYFAPGRHGLWGLVFLIPHVSIQIARLWDAILWTVPYFLLGLTLAYRTGVARDRLGRWSFALWSLLFINQGPVYAPLIVSGLILALGYDRRRPRRTAAFTFLACLYAGVSRWTWLAAPAMLAGLWSLLDSPPDKGLLRRLRVPVGVGLAGLGGALASQILMALAFPQPEAAFATAARQTLLWYRLLPSATNSHGIIPSLAVVLSPLVLLLVAWVWRRLLQWDRLQLFGILAVLGAFLVVGLAASVKIGGGNNLHNLDMLLMGLVFLAAIALAGLGDRLGAAVDRTEVLLGLTVLIPSALAVQAMATLVLPPAFVVSASLERVHQAAAVAGREGEVLFIDQRQLFAFGHLADVPLVLDYELKHLMNQAMGANRGYLERFQRDLAEHRFALIVVDPVADQFQGRYRAFGEENDAWVEHVAIPLLESYRLSTCFEEVGVCLYVPKE